MSKVVPILFITLLIHTPIQGSDTLFQYKNKLDHSLLETPHQLPSIETTKRTYLIKNASPQALIRGIHALFPEVKTLSFAESNQLILSGSKHDITSLLKLLPDWDIKPQPIKFTIEFYEVAESTFSEFDMHIDTLSDGISLSLPLTKTPLDLPKKLNQTIRLLRTSDKASLLAKPAIETLIGNDAEIQIVDQIPYVSKTIHADRIDTFLNQLHTGIGIKLSPSQKINNHIQTDVAITVTNVKLWKQIGDSELPIITERRLTTKANLIIGETMMIAGLLQQEEKENSYETPFLVKIPLIGRLFKSKQKEYVSTDVVILITPKIN